MFYKVLLYTRDMTETILRSALQTLAYFDIFDFPLTKEELYRFLWRPPVGLTFAEFLMALEECANQEIISHNGGYYFLPNRENIVAIRERKVVIVEKKLTMARRAARKIRFVPFVEAMYVANTVAAGVASEESDVDVLIVIKKNYLWLGRLLVTLTLSLFRLRRTKICVQDRVCLSFYVTEEAFDLSAVALDSSDIYLSYWLDQLAPVFDSNNILKKIQNKNQWIKNNLPQALRDYCMLSRGQIRDLKFIRQIRRAQEFALDSLFGNRLEQLAKKIQEAKMNRDYTSLHYASDHRVVVNDSMIKFHENDRRRYYRNLWLKRCNDVSRKEAVTQIEAPLLYC